MFNENYNSYACETAIKKVAKAIYVIGIILIVLSFIAFIVFASIDDDIIWLGAVIMVALSVIGICCMLSSHVVWGFGDIVGNTKKIAASGASAVDSTVATAIDPEELPEL